MALKRGHSVHIHDITLFLTCSIELQFVFSAFELVQWMELGELSPKRVSEWQSCHSLLTYCCLNFCCVWSLLAVGWSGGGSIGIRGFT